LLIERGISGYGRVAANATILLTILMPGVGDVAVATRNATQLPL
jgi:hypothetical protein